MRLDDYRDATAIREVLTFHRTAGSLRRETWVTGYGRNRGYDILSNLG